MSQLKGAYVAVKYDRIDEFNWTNAQGQVVPIRKFVGLKEFGDGRIDWVDIGFPRDPGYVPPRLNPGTTYMMPVMLGIDRKRGAVRLTIRTDTHPFEAPEIE